MGKPSILIVDDEAMVLTALERWFRARGFRTQLAYDGVEAVERCRERGYDAVIMDLEMPRMNGVDAIREIKKMHPAMPIVILTGYYQASEDARDCGAERLFHKPVSLRALEEEIRKLLPEPGEDAKSA